MGLSVLATPHVSRLLVSFSWTSLSLLGWETPSLAGIGSQGRLDQGGASPDPQRGGKRVRTEQGTIQWPTSSVPQRNKWDLPGQRGGRM